MNTPETNNQNQVQNEQIPEEIKFPDAKKAVISMIIGIVAFALSVISLISMSTPFMIIVAVLAVVGIILAAQYLKEFPKVGLSELGNYKGLQGFKNKEYAIAGLTLSIMAIAFILFVVLLLKTLFRF